jgi:protein-S-isoprenylcysteine O-methyltransferase Ste14
MIKRLRRIALIFSWMYCLPTISSTFWLPMWISLSLIFPTIFNYFPETPSPFRLDWVPQWVFRILYVSWIPMTLIPGADWLTEFLHLPEIWTNFYLVLLLDISSPFLTFGGFLFFMASMIQLIISKLRGVRLVKSGFYSIVRHPQYLGIFVWSLGHLLYALPFHLRPADLIAWVTLVFLYILLAKSEEKSLEHNFGEEYVDYKNSVPFIIPFMPNKIRKAVSEKMALLTPKGKWKKRILVIFTYILIIFLILIFTYGRTYCYWEKSGP